MRLQGTIGSSAAALDGPGAINWATRDAPQGVTAHYAASLTIADGLRLASLPPPTSAGSCEDGRVSIRFQGVALSARPFHKDGCVTQGSIVENKLLSGALTEIRKRQQQKEHELVQSAKTKREKRIVRDRFAGALPPPGP